MDPNETLRMVRNYVERINRLRDAATESDLRTALESESTEEMAFAIAEYAEALDEWLSRGGFLPEAWERKS